MATSVGNIGDGIGMLARMLNGGYTTHFESTDTTNYQAQTVTYTITENDDYAELYISHKGASYYSYVGLLSPTNNVEFYFLDTRSYADYSRITGIPTMQIDLRGLAGHKLQFVTSGGDNARAWAKIYTKGGTS